MKNPATFRRSAAALSMAATAVLSAVSVVLQPDLEGSGAHRLAAIDAAGTTAAVSAATFVVAQLPAIVAMLGISQLIRRRSPRLSSWGALLGVLGAFGHSVFGGMMLFETSMAADADNRAAFGKAIDHAESTPLMIFALLGLVGTVLGLAVLSVGLWRSRTVARWVPATLGSFILVEFVAGGMTTWAAPFSALLFVAAMGSLALTTWRSPAAVWTTQAEQTEQTERNDAAVLDPGTGAGGSPVRTRADLS